MRRGFIPFLIAACLQGCGGGTPSGGGSGGAAGAANGGSTGAGGGGMGGATGGATGTGGTAGAAGAGGAAGAVATGGSGGGGQPDAGGPADCPGAAYDPASPPVALTLSGSLGAHDPAGIVVGNMIYLYATGLSAKTSANLTSWQNATGPLNPRPAWVAQMVPGATNLWAPDVSSFGGTYHLYYAASTFGSNKSCIGHATRASLTAGSWADQGVIICSNMG